MKNLIKVYRIVNTETDDVFIGSTAQPLFKRLYIIRADASSGKASALCNLMRQLGKDKFRIELLEEFPYSSADHTKAIEMKYIPKLQNSDVSSSSDFDTETSFYKLYAKLADTQIQLQNVESIHTNESRIIRNANSPKDIAIT